MTEPEWPAAAVLAWAALPGPSKVLAVLRRRAESSQSTSTGSVRIALGTAERGELGRVLGSSWAAGGTAVNVPALNRALHERGTSVLAVVQACGGPLRLVRQEKAARDDQRATERADAETTLTGAGLDAEQVRWLLTGRRLPPPGTGALRAACAHLAQVLAALPGPQGEPVLLSVLAQRLFSDPHALDRDQPRGRWAARALAALDGRDRSDPLAPAAWRVCWSEHGVMADALSSTVLVLNVPLDGEGPAAQLSRTAAACGEPLWLTLRALAAGGWHAGDLLRAGSVLVRVCENPTVVQAAADAYAASSAALVCTYGRPSGAALVLLRGLAAAGVAMGVRADDDRAGQSIVAQLRADLPNTELWQYEQRSIGNGDAVTYEEELLDRLVSDLGPPV